MNDESTLTSICYIKKKNTCINGEWVMLEGCTALPSCVIQFLVTVKPTDSVFESNSSIGHFDLN